MAISAQFLMQHGDTEGTMGFSSATERYLQKMKRVTGCGFNLLPFIASGGGIRI
jgi:hypothetical protein